MGGVAEDVVLSWEYEVLRMDGYFDGTVRYGYLRYGDEGGAWVVSVL